MITLQDIQAVYPAATSYPDLAQKLSKLGILSYSVDVSIDIICYRLAEGQLIIQYANHEPKAIAPSFSKAKVIAAIQANIAKQTTYPEFMRDIALAGVHFYEATLTGVHKRVTYIGISDSHIEQIPSL
jgi:uncharacterized protein YbcV (DUF1398 family)